MKRKSMLSLLAAIMLVSVIGIGSTLAYFSDNEDVSNVVTMGHVDINLTENKVTLGKDEDGKRTWIQDTSETGLTEEGIVFNDALPGDTIPKNPTITVMNGSEDAYVRVKLEFNPTSENGIDSESLIVLAERLYEDIAAEGIWTKNGDYLYYPSKLSSGNTAVVFNEVNIPGTWSNITAGKGFTIKVTAEAIQAEHVEPIIQLQDGKVVGWDLGEGDNAIEIEKYPL